MVLARRFAVILALLFWQGGFFFYTSVVVPTATDVIGGLQQGFITRHVTVILNSTAAIVLGILLLGWFLDRASHKGRHGPTLFFWIGMAVCQLGLFWLHPQLDRLLDPDLSLVNNRHEFRFLHRIYLWVSTVQWGCAVLFLLLTLAAWRRRDFAGDAD